jgi:hypothetical protein
MQTAPHHNVFVFLSYFPVPYCSLTSRVCPFLFQTVSYDDNKHGLRCLCILLPEMFCYQHFPLFTKAHYELGCLKVIVMMSPGGFWEFFSHEFRKFPIILRAHERSIINDSQYTVHVRHYVSSRKRLQNAPHCQAPNRSASDPTQSQLIPSINKEE